MYSSNGVLVSFNNFIRAFENWPFQTPTSAPLVYPKSFHIAAYPTCALPNAMDPAYLDNFSSSWRWSSCGKVAKGAATTGNNADERGPCSRGGEEEVVLNGVRLVAPVEEVDAEEEG